jgi:pyruvate formate lyase activating enzyme
MKIGGFLPMTLSDYPGQVAAAVFTQGCNFRCPFCHNAALLATDPPSETLMRAKQVFDHLDDRRDLLDAVTITGGEPTIQPDLMEFVGQIKDKGFKVKLDTNGSRPALLRELLASHMLDCVAMDIKAPLGKYARLTGVEAPIENIRESIALLAESDTPCEFRTTYVPSLLTADDLREIRSCLPQGARHTVQPFVPDNALDASLRSLACHSAGDSKVVSLSKPGDDTNNVPYHVEFLSGE